MRAVVHNKQALLHRLLTHQREIKSFGVRQLGLFGSFANGTTIHDDSDVDFLVEFEKGQKTFDNFMELAFYLEELLGRKVELVTPQSLSPYLGPTILKEVENVIP
jgi:predicted nucleotidyltransferase